MSLEVGGGFGVLIRMDLVLDNFEFRMRAAAVVENVVPGLKIALKKTNGGAINGAVLFFVIEGVDIHGLIITKS